VTAKLLDYPRFPPVSRSIVINTNILDFSVELSEIEELWSNKMDLRLEATTFFPTCSNSTAIKYKFSCHVVQGNRKCDDPGNLFDRFQFSNVLDIPGGSIG